MRQSPLQSLSHYTVKSFVGSTSLATVYVAEDPDRQEDVALKVLRPYISQQTQVVQRFLEHMNRVRLLDHPNICPVYEAQRTEDTCYVAMRYVPWPTLHQYLQEPVPLAEALGILQQVIQAVEYAHSQGIAHRNLKPSNIFVDPDGEVLVTDFGTAVLVEALQEDTTGAASQLMVTSYRAPEQAEHEPIEPHTDIYALGALAYHVLTGRLPFYAPDASVLLAKQRTSTPTPPSALVPGLPAEADAVVLQALTHWPHGRQQSVQEFREALEGALEPTARTASVMLPGMPSARAGRPRDNRKVGASEDDADAEVRYCTTCDTLNPPTASHCSYCWKPLEETEVMEAEEGRRQQARVRRRRKRKRRIVGALAGTALLAIVGVIVGMVNAPPPEYAPPTTPSLSSASTQPGEWAMFRGDPGRSGLAPQGSFTPGGDVLWTFESRPMPGSTGEEFQSSEEKPASPIFASPAVRDGTVYQPTGGGRLVALDAESGALVWEHELGGPVNSSPAVAGNSVFVGLRDGRLIAVDRGTGERRWEYATDNPIFGSPVVHQGTVYLGSTDGNLYALDGQTGSLRWKFASGGWIVSSPAVNEAVVAFATNQGELRVLDRDTGLQRRAFNLKGPSISSPVLDGTQSVIGAENGILWTVDWRVRQSDLERWWYNVRLRLFIVGIIDDIESREGFQWLYKFPGKRERVLGSAAVAHGHAFACSDRGRCVALDLETGEQVWETSTEGAVFSSPVIVGDVMYVGSNDTSVYGFDVDTGEQVWRFETRGQVTADPVVANGTMYVASQDGTLYAVR